MPDYQPPFTLTNTTLKLVADIGEAIGRLSAQLGLEQNLRLRRINRIRTIKGSLAIEGNTLTEEQITVILAGKRVIAPPKEVKEAHNAISAYELLDTWHPTRNKDLLAAHKALMIGLVDEAGMYRSAGVGVMSGKDVVHMAPQADRVPKLMADLFAWLRLTDTHPLIASCVFHYEFEFIHPFSDGNGRVGRLWQTLILSKWQPVFINIPVESLVHQHQEDYYQAIRRSTSQGDSAPFVEFMLQMVMSAIAETESAPKSVGLNDGTSDGLKSEVKLSDQDKAVLTLIRADPYVTIQKIAQSLDKSVRTIERRIKYLKDNSLISRVGAKKSGKWIVHSE